MQPRTVFLAVAILAFACTTTYAQAKKLPVLPEYTPQQRWARAQDGMDVYLAAAFGYAKSLNHTAEDFTQYCVTVFAPSWGKPDSVSPMRVLRGMRWNLLAYPDRNFELIDSLENKAIGRFNRPYLSRRFKDNASFYGMTANDYEGHFRGFNRGLCDYLHLKYEDKVEGEWITFTISRK